MGKSQEHINFILQGEVISELLLPLQNEILSAHNEYDLKVPFRLYISSIGGEVETGLSLVSIIHMIRREGRRFDTHIAGAAYSTGAFISQAGSWRTIDEFGFLMLHEQTNTVDEETPMRESELRRWAAQIAASNESIVALLSRRSGMEPGEIAHCYFNQDDVYIGAVAALERGFVDEIVSL